VDDDDQVDGARLGCGGRVHGDGRQLRRGAPLTTRLPQRKMARPATEGRLLTVTFVERPDTSGDRWSAAMALLLEAGQVPEEVASA
jgi:hypothetical protein